MSLGRVGTNENLKEPKDFRMLGRETRHVVRMQGGGPAFDDEGMDSEAPGRTHSGMPIARSQLQVAAVLKVEAVRIQY